MKHKLITAAIATALVMPVVSHAEATLYGSVRAGAVYSDADTPGTKSTWDFGATGVDGGVGGQGLYSRVGFKGSNDLGNGLSAGFKVERGIGADSLGTRHTNVYLSGGFGTVTLGQQGNPYRNAAHWDQAWFLGGQRRGRDGDGGSRLEGIAYSLSTGPFSFDLAFTGRDSSVDDNDTYVTTDDTTVTDGDDADQTIIGASYDFGPVKLSAAINDRADDTKSDLFVLGLNGSAGPVSWNVAYQQNEDNRVRRYVDAMDAAGALGTADPVVGPTDDQAIIGVYLGFSLGERDTIYVEYEDLSADQSYNAEVEDTTPNNDLPDGYLHANAGDSDSFLLGYSRSIGPNTTFIAEYLKLGSDASDADPSVLALALKVDF